MSFFFERTAELYVSNVTSGWNSGNTDKIPLKAGFSFDSEQILSSFSRNTIKENESRAVSKYSARQPLVNFNFSTYMNPVTGVNISSTDRYLWEGLGTYIAGPTYSQISFTSTNVKISKELTIWVKFKDTVYRLDRCVIVSAEIVGKINDLAHIVWTGRAHSITNVGNISIANTELTFDTYIKNKLSTIDLTISPTTYDIPITDYSIIIKNNISHIYRARIGDIQRITGHYTDTRMIDGDFSAYLKYDVNKSAVLLDHLRNMADDLENNLASFTIHTGKTTEAHVDFIMPNTILEVPSQQFTDLVTLRVPFSALESQKGAADELTVRYYI
jgi:hypothetical protein